MKCCTSSALYAELKQFKRLYCAVYHLRSSGDGFDYEDVLDKAERWNQYFYSCFLNYTKFFETIRPWLLKLIGNHIAPIINNPSNQFCDVYSGYMKVLNAKEEDRQRLLFQCNLDTIKRFQTQKLISEINTKTNVAVNMKLSFVNMPYWSFQSEYTYRISHYEELYYAFDWIMDKMYEYRRIENCMDNTGMWFRGVSNAEHSIVPSGFVRFYEDCVFLQGNCLINNSNYLSCQRRLYENFRYVADGAPEHQNPSFYTAIDHLALMQHYQQHSNLLDWSEDINTGLYFALEKEIIVHEKYCDVLDDRNYDDPDKDAVVYILDPIRFNRACDEMEKELKIIDPYKSYDFELFERIPNLSVLQLDNPFSEYYDFYKLSINNRWIELEEHADKCSLALVKDTGDNTLKGRLPRAIYTSKINPRLKAQSGMFVAFSLLSRPAFVSGQNSVPEGDRTKLFNYQSINELQDLYLGLGSRKESRNPFLYKIIIPRELKRLIGRALHRLGFSKEKFYPEIQNHHTR